MKALVLAKYKHFELVDLPRPSPGSGEVLVQVAACGICGSDVHGYDGSSGRRIPPIVMGHEAAGVVAEVGAGVHSWQPGDRVTFDSTVSCGECAFCRRGDVNLCERREVIGVSCTEFRRAGAFAEYLVVPARILSPLPDAMPFAEAAMLEAVSVALHAVRMAGVRGGETALIVGAGMIGLLTLQAARMAGCSRVLVADIDATRLRMAETLGADEALHLSGGEMIREVLRRTPAGVDVALEAVGREETVTAAIESVVKGGVVVLIGNISPRISIPLQTVVSRQLRLQGTAASAGEYPKAIEWVASGKIKVKPLISAVAPLEEGPRWFERLYANEPNLMKIVLAPLAEKL